MSVSSCALLSFSFSLSLSSSCADEMKKKKKKKENRKKQMSPCYVERFACQWSLIDVSRFSYFVSLNLFFITISVYFLKFPLLFLSFFSFGWQVEVSDRVLLSRSDPITAFIHIRIQNSSYFCYCPYNGKKKLYRHSYLYHSSSASNNRRVYTLRAET